MNKTNIEWTEYTWNPITGCKKRCWYCYAHAMAKRFNGGDFEPRFHPERLNDPGLKAKKSRKIFVCSMSDLFGDGVEDEWIRTILNTIERYPQHKFQILTKCPERAEEWIMPENVWLGVTSCGVDADRITVLKRISATVKFVSFEPLIDSPVRFPIGGLEGIDWVIIGALTGPQAKQPSPFDIEDILEEARRVGTAVFQKNNLDWPKKIQEWPK